MQQKLEENNKQAYNQIQSRGKKMESKSLDCFQQFLLNQSAVKSKSPSW